MVLGVFKSLSNALIGRSSSRIALLPMILAYGSIFMLAISLFIGPCAYYSSSADEYYVCSKGMMEELESFVSEVIG